MELERRMDTPLTEIVRTGIAIDATRGVVRAWSYMTANNVPQPVMLRVLSQRQSIRREDLVASLIGWDPLAAG